VAEPSPVEHVAEGSDADAEESDGLLDFGPDDVLGAAADDGPPTTNVNDKEADAFESIWGDDDEDGGEYESALDDEGDDGEYESVLDDDDDDDDAPSGAES
jgi:hypothetical protein